MLQTLKELCALDAPSGYEEAVREELLRRIGSHAQVSVDPLGNILAFKKGASTPAKKILLDAHMDEVGFLITAYTADGFLRFAPLGGIDPAVVFGRRVRVCGQIGVIGGHWQQSDTAVHRGLGCRQAFEKWKIPFTDDQYEAVRFSYEDGYRGAQALLQRNPGLTAIFAMSDVMAIGAIRALQDLGKRVPEDVSVVGFDDFLYPGLCNVPLTTYAVNMTEMAERSIELLITKVTGGETSEGMHLVEGRFVERKSVRAI